MSCNQPGNAISSSILTLLESVSEDFESKNGISTSELTLFSSGWGFKDEGLDLKGSQAKRVFSFIGSILTLLESVSEDFD